MTEIINLRQKRKQKMREDKAKKAEENRRHFGRTKSEKAITRKENAQQATMLDGKKLHD